MTHLLGEGDTPPTLIIVCALPVHLLLCITTARTIVVIPVIIPPPLLTLGNNASITSYVRWGGPLLGDATDLS